MLTLIQLRASEISRQIYAVYPPIKVRGWRRNPGKVVTLEESQENPEKQWHSTKLYIQKKKVP